jgi:phage terminase large subunit-like protein
MNPAVREAARLIREVAQTDPAKAAAILGTMADDDLEDVAVCWQLQARPLQLRPIEPGKRIWINKSGRGTGKTRGAAEETLDRMEDWGERMRGAIVSKTIGDVRTVMLEGVSGLEACARRRGYKLKHLSNKSLVEHPSGAILHTMSAESVEFGVGPNINYFWLDEVSAWPKNALIRLKQFLFAWRLPAPTPDRKPIGVITMTPKPNEISRWVLRSREMLRKTMITCEPTVANRANIMVDDLLDLFEGTNLGRQELEGAELDDEGAIITLDQINDTRTHDEPEGLRKIVSLDPSIMATDQSDAAGIVVVGADGRDKLPHSYVIADYTVKRASFSKWARQSVVAALVHDCEAIVAEINQGGGGIVEALELAMAEIGEELNREIVIPVRPIWARQSKRARAEPVGVLYERGRVHHIGIHKELEKELSTWVPGMKSPNRMDALVHGVTHLVFGDSPYPSIASMYADEAA